VNLKTGEKIKGILSNADSDGIVINVVKRVAVEGAKKKKDVTDSLQLAYPQIKSAKLLLSLRDKKEKYLKRWRI